jgi:hypothetical protein
MPPGLHLSGAGARYQIFDILKQRLYMLCDDGIVTADAGVFAI